jgi:hypothetical protein
MAARIDAGTVWVKKHLDLSPDTPHSGAKQSGLGVAFGKEGLKKFTQTSMWRNDELEAPPCAQGASDRPGKEFERIVVFECTFRADV